MTRKGIGLRPRLTGAHKKWRPISIGMPGEARQFLLIAGHNRDMDAGILSSLIRGLQNAGVWDKYLAIYPFYPGLTPSANNHRWNIKNPQDTTAAYRITWSGTVSHTTTGISSASEGHGLTNLIPSTAGMSASSATIAAYTTIDTVFNAVIVGTESNGAEWAVSMSGSPTGTFYPAIVSNGSYPNVEITTGGLFHATRLDASTILGYKNGIEVVNAAQGSTAVPNISFALLGKNTTVGIDATSTQILRYAAIGAGITAIEAADEYTAVQEYQTALGRAL